MTFEALEKRIAAMTEAEKKQQVAIYASHGDGHLIEASSLESSDGTMSDGDGETLPAGQYYLYA